MISLYEYKEVVSALTYLSGLVREGVVPRYSVVPGAALNSVMESDVIPALRHSIRVLERENDE